MSGNCNFSETIGFILPKEGDKIYTIYLKITLPELNINNLNNDNLRIKWNDYIGFCLIENLQLKIGGQTIVNQTGEYMQIWTSLNDDDANKLRLIDQDEYFTKPQKNIESETLYIPLQFWFNQKYANSLPIIALQYHNIEISIKLRDFHECYTILEYNDPYTKDFLRHNNSNIKYNVKNTNIIETGLETTCIYLNSPERKRISQTEHEYLITQVQSNIGNITSSNFVNIPINFNHPITEILFTIQPINFSSVGEVFNFSSRLKYPDSNINTQDELEEWEEKPNKHILKKAAIKFNNLTRVDWKNYQYYYYKENYENHANKLENYVYMYSFSMDPNNSSPHGSCNFSRLESANLLLELNTNLLNDSDFVCANGNSKKVEVKVYGINYNILKIKDGMAGTYFNN